MNLFHCLASYRFDIIFQLNVLQQMITGHVVHLPHNVVMVRVTVTMTLIVLETLFVALIIVLMVFLV